jgi:hypothetical protein
MVHVPSWFYIFTGAVLALTGLAQVVLRARDQGARGFLSFAAAFSVLSVLLGLLVVYYGIFVHR